MGSCSSKLQLDIPFLFGSSRAGYIQNAQPEESYLPEPPPEMLKEGLLPLIEAIFDYIPPPFYEEGVGLQALVTNLDASPYLGRLAICRIVAGEVKKGQQITHIKRDGSQVRIKCAEHPNQKIVLWFRR